jgi:hypothetical protein
MSLEWPLFWQPRADIGTESKWVFLNGCFGVPTFGSPTEPDRAGPLDALAGGVSLADPCTRVGY